MTMVEQNTVVIKTRFIEEREVEFDVRAVRRPTAVRALAARVLTTGRLCWTTLGFLMTGLGSCHIKPAF